MLDRSMKQILALGLAALPTLIWAAESLPASVRACTAETDSLRRLMCFDREVAKFPDPKAAAQTNRSQPAATTATSSPPPPPPPASPSARPSAAPPTASSSASTNAAATESADAPAAASKTDTGTKPSRITARVVSIDHSPNEMVLHLDNGEVWQQIQGIAGDLSLKAGDSVTIDKHLGGYYLNGPHVSGMKVRQN